MRRRHSHPKRLIVIASSPRTGSSLFYRSLHEAGIGGTTRHGEILDPKWFSARLIGLSRIRYRIGRPYSAMDKASPRSMRAAIRAIANESTGDDGTLLLKVHWRQLHRLHRHGLDLDAFGAPIIWLRLRRVDHLQQAVSLARAHQTQRWQSSQEELRLPTYDADLIAEQLEEIRLEEEGWDAYLSALGADRLEITYEELDSNFESTMQRTFDYIGASTAIVPPRPMARQADGINAEWVDRYLSNPHK